MAPMDTNTANGSRRASIGPKAVPSDIATSEVPSTTALEQTPPPKADSKAAQNGKPQPPPGPTKEEKISSAELKRKKQAEKQAKRAASRVAPPPQQNGTNSKQEAGKPQNAKGVAQKGQALPTPGSGKHGKQLGPKGADQSQLPLRGTTSHSHELTKPPEEEKHVELLSHLYEDPGQGKRGSITTAGKDIHPRILALGLQLSHYVICGSSARCVAMLLAFKSVIASYTTPPGTALSLHLGQTYFSPQIKFLKTCRPFSISMSNAMRLLKRAISKTHINTPDNRATTELCTWIDDFIRERLTVADQVIAISAASQIVGGDVVLTYAKSSIVEQTLIKAYDDLAASGKTFRVIVVDSRPLFEGKNLKRALASHGIEVQYYLTTGLTSAMRSATKVFLGAHAMMFDGALYSRVGTAQVAMSAYDAGVPVIVCCEGIKFTDEVPADSIARNEIAPPEELVVQDAGDELGAWRGVKGLHLLNLMYDLTPAEYIKMVITEYGSVPPSAVPAVHRLIHDA